MKAKKQTFKIALIIIIIMGMTSCCKRINETKTCSKRSVFPNYSNLGKSILYYNIEDHCSFQTLVFQPCFADKTKFGEDIPSENHNAYSILGRFNGKSVSDSVYQVDSLEVKHFFLDLDDEINGVPVRNYKIGKVQLLNTSHDKEIKIVFDLIKGDRPTEDDSLDYTYGRNTLEKPFFIHEDATINFYVRDATRTSVLEFMGCASISPEDAGIAIGGGYECNGRPAYRGGR